MKKIIGWIILIGFFIGLHTILFIKIGTESLWIFLAYPMTMLIVFAVYLITHSPSNNK